MFQNGFHKAPQTGFEMMASEADLAGLRLKKAALFYVGMVYAFVTGVEGYPSHDGSGGRKYDYWCGKGNKEQ